MLRKILFLFLFIGSFNVVVKSQHGNIPVNEIMIRLQKLNTLGSVLYFAAHPDDENTRLIAWLAQERKYRTGYLSLTRGDGGQNLIGTEQGIDLGLIRTQELLAARATDKGEQFFSSAYDFGFSKTHTETFDFWDKETALREAVWIIRKFRPDIIINRFPPDKRGGHGHHQASAMLAHEAFIAAADPARFTEQLTQVVPWKAKRLLWNTANFGGMNNTAENQLKADIGAYSPLLGESYGEIAARSRSQHKSQGFGAASTRGSSIEYFEHVAGDSAEKDLMDDIETTWARIPDSQPIQSLVNKIITEFIPSQPEKSISALFELRERVQQIADSYWKEQKTKEIEEIIVACAGIWTDAFTSSPQYAVNKNFEISLEAIARRPNLQVQLIKTTLGKVDKTLTTNVSWKAQHSYISPNITQPYWLEREHSLGKFDVRPEDVGYPTNPIRPTVTFTFMINGKEISRTQNIQYRTVDPVRGEIYSPIAITPTLTADIASPIMLSINGEEKTVKITFERQDDSKDNFQIDLSRLQGWEILPQQLSLNFGNERVVTRTVRIKPTGADSQRSILQLSWNGEILKSIKTINHEHIPLVTWFPKATVDLQRITLTNTVKTIGYIPGAGDMIPQALNEIDIEVTNLNGRPLSIQVLNQYDAIVVGVRYFNTNTQAPAVKKVLMDYVHQGGVVLLQYNVNSKLYIDQIGPFPFSLSRDRVTEEDAIVKFDTKDPALNYPNEISDSDFSGWVQERGLYFADKIDKNYRTPLLMHDKDEKQNNGALLIAPYGKGKFVYTSLSFFRQLPAGVPGAYRLFINLLTKE
ncbi:PIG-L family deacetylase [Sphingobacterium lumbrici]|uniref:PIG-L family deacetylase n=1 Tax=Sphingobacterium lumbrici TaxID=2559600 RepID=UPI001128B9EC|nr:PIG-L family deacetylase [Sphingobacterium lumbrici]